MSRNSIFCHIEPNFINVYNLEPTTGFEPVTSPLPRKCSNQLSYVGTSTLNIIITYNIKKIKNKLQDRKIWSWRLDLNQRPTDYKSVALPTELRQHYFAIRFMERETGLEPATYSLEGCRSTN